MNTSDSTLHRFSFNGKTGEYFRICIVNFLLIVITLGLYMPWAKIRTRRYLYGSTSLAGFGNFDYHANPWTILVSRLIVVFVVFGGAYWAGEKALENFIYTAALFLLLPWAVVRSLAFNARYTSFGGVRFLFDKKYGVVYFLFLPSILLALVFPAAFLLSGKEDIAAAEADPSFFLVAGGIASVLLLLMMLAGPWLTRAYHAFRASNHSLGAGVQFDFAKKGIGDYIKGIWLPPLLATAIGFIFGFAVGFAQAVSGGANTDAFGGFLVGIVSPLLSLLITWALIAAFLLKAFWNRVEFFAGSYRGRFIADFSVFAFAFKIILVNAVAITLSLGLLYAWAKIRRTRFLAAHICMHAPAEMLQNLPALTGAGESALGAELDSVEGFDFDVGLI